VFFRSEEKVFNFKNGLRYLFSLHFGRPGFSKGTDNIDGQLGVQKLG
jgi:hypothetical protein